MDDDKQRPHLWIPEEEVDRLNNEPQGRNKPRDVTHGEHGKKLSRALEAIVAYYKEMPQGALPEDLVVFKVLLPESEKLDNKQRRKFLEDNGLTVNAVKDRRNAVVSTTPHLFQRLRNRIENYRERGKFTDFQYIDGFEPFTVSDKQASGIRRLFLQGDKPPEKVDIQLMLMPNLTSGKYESAMSKMRGSIEQVCGEYVEDFILSDGTPVVRTIIPSMAIEWISQDDSVYRVEETKFFTAVEGEETDTFLPMSLELNPEIALDALPVVVILDTGIQLPEPLNQLVFTRWVADGVTPGDNPHGTAVASRAIFGTDLANQLIENDVLTPRVRVLDAVVLDGEVSDIAYMKRVRKAVEQLSGISKIFNISANIKESPIEGDEISITGYELDNLMRLHDVQFLISSGNHKVWPTADSLEEVLDDDDTRISAPADSMLGITVGAIAGREHPLSLSKVNEIAPFSRRGPGFAGFTKPDLVSYGGNAYYDAEGKKFVNDRRALVLIPNGETRFVGGTSFAAPVVAGDLAVIASQIPGGDILMAKALLYHGAAPLWDDDGLQIEDLEFIANLYGRGLSDPDRSLFSSPSRVTFVRAGELDRLTKEHVRFHMPSVLAAKPGRNTARVTVTCVSKPPIYRDKGQEYLGAFISASLHKVGNGEKLPSVNPKGGFGRRNWDVCHHFWNNFSKFNAGDWQVWLELRTRWDVTNDVKIPYAMAITIEDLSGDIDIYNEILNETRGRFMPMTSIHIPVR
ncbi:conserved hypothetical protein [Desulforamulus reducens MI-1]|uniref:Peptidase S8/S53 domain-containing protein n=1 Tax=Desulforamulus reducens (strain ATCC BAA-1160 / DSM 100696 / MI-1) TaxID=349161 RepID=A4J1W5_DESRM|nr:S8 family peptidase [Desulforamulus reducens]ABO49068.1 conserved hypothetical protein [Desulforamulus reducens MI-1]